MSHPNRERVAWSFRKRAFLVAAVIAGTVAAFVTATGSAVGASGFTVAGKVQNGLHPIGGATVYLQAWPSEATQLATPAGKHVSLDALAMGRTATDGSYSLTTNLARVPKRDVNADGTINVRETVVGSNGWYSTTSFPTNLKSSRPSQTENITHGSINHVIASNQRAMARERSAHGSAVTPIASSADSVCGIPNGGYWTAGYGPKDVKLVTVMNDNGIGGEVTYSEGSETSTTLGVAAYDGTSWSASGSVTEGATTGGKFDIGGLQNVIQDGWWYYHDYVVTDGGNICTETAYPDYYYGKGDKIAVNHSYYSYCDTEYPVGGKFERDAGKNGSYSSGITLYGVNLVSQAGWDSSMTLAFHFNTTAGWVCGNTDLGPFKAPRVDAHVSGGTCGALQPPTVGKRPDVLVC